MGRDQAQSSKNEDPGCREILENFSISIEQVADRVYLALSEDHIRREIASRRPGYKCPSAAVRRENGERGSQAGPQAAGRGPNSQASKNDRHDILGKPIALYRAQRPKDKGRAGVVGP
jgi:hypothetical protein